MQLIATDGVDYSWQLWSLLHCVYWCSASATLHQCRHQHCQSILWWTFLIVSCRFKHLHISPIEYCQEIILQSIIKLNNILSLPQVTVYDIAFRLISPIEHNKAVRRQKVSDLIKIWYVCRGWWVIYDSMPYDPIQSQGQGHGGLKCVEMAHFKGCLLRQYASNQKSNRELWYSKTISKFQPDRFFIFVLVQLHVKSWTLQVCGLFMFGIILLCYV